MKSMCNWKYVPDNCNKLSRARTDTIINYHIAGNFRMVEILVYFVLKSITRKLKLAKISLHNNVNIILYVLRICMFYVYVCSTYVTMLSCTNIQTFKICTTENYPLYGTCNWQLTFWKPMCPQYFYTPE